jgi:hypothetical protein
MRRVWQTSVCRTGKVIDKLKSLSNATRRYDGTNDENISNIRQLDL